MYRVENSRKVIFLKPFEECVGVLLHVETYQGTSFAAIGRYNVMIPQKFANLLAEFVGMRIGVLRTDDAEKPYRYRIISKCHGGAEEGGS